MSNAQPDPTTDGWIEHRRADDDELLGFLAPSADGFVALTVFGYPLAASGNRGDAEQTLNSGGLSCLAEKWTLRLADQSLIQVEITEASPHQVVVKNVGFGGVHDYGQRFILSAPVDDRLELGSLARP